MSTTTYTCTTCHDTGIDPDFLSPCGPCQTARRIDSEGRKLVIAPSYGTTDQGALAEWLAAQTWSEFAQSLASFYRTKGYLTEKQEASARSMKAKMDAKAPKAAPATDAEKVTETGFYRRSADGIVYKVQAARSTGNLYASRLRETGKGFDYETGAIRTLKASEKLDLEAAKAFGRETGRCCVCGAELTNEDSVEAGIGPICAGKF